MRETRRTEAVVSEDRPDLKLTYEDLQAFPEDGKRHEIVDGEHFVTPSPRTGHQAVSMRLGALLHSFVEGQSLGVVLAAPCDVVLSAADVVEPDLLFVSSAHGDRVTESNVQGPPDLVVEILSESTRRIDEVVKRKLYERFRVPEYWIVDPELETVKVYRQGVTGYERVAELSREAGDVLTTPLLPGFEAPLSRVFEQRGTSS